MNFIDRLQTRALTPVAQSASREVRVLQQVASNPVAYNTPGRPLFPDWAGEAGIKHGYLANIYVYRCVEVLANSISALPFRSGMNPDDKTNFDRGSRLSYLLGPEPGGPNPEFTSAELWKYSLIQYLLLGKFAWYLNRNSLGEVVEIWPLQAQHLKPILNTSANPDRYFSKYEYGNKGSRGYKEFRPDEVSYFWRKSAADPRQPQTVLQAANVEVAVANIIDQYAFSLFQNHCMPATIVTTEPFATKEDRQAFQQQFLDLFLGPTKAGKTIFTESGSGFLDNEELPPNAGQRIHVEKLSLTSTESGQLEQRAVSIRDICIAFGVPVSILGDASQRTFSNAGQEYKSWWKVTILPLMHEMEQLVNKHLAPTIESIDSSSIKSRFVGWFDTSEVEELEPERPKFTGADLVKCLDAGVLTTDEFRDRLGLPPMLITNGNQNQNQNKNGNRNQNKVRGKRRITTVDEMLETEEHTIWTLGSSASGPCDECESLEGTIDPEEEPEVDTHPGCQCEVVPYVPARSRRKPEDFMQPTQTEVLEIMEDLMSSYFRHALELQHESVKARASGRRGRQNQNKNLPLSALLDPEYHQERARKLVEPLYAALGRLYSTPALQAGSVAHRLVTGTVQRLEQSSTPDDAFQDIEQRAQDMAKVEIAGMEPVPLDHVVVLLDAMRMKKMEPDKALDTFRRLG